MAHNIEALLGQIVVGSTVYYMSPEPEFAIRKSIVAEVHKNIVHKPFLMNKVYVLANGQRLRWHQAYATRESANAALVEKLKSQLLMHKIQFENLRHIIEQEERSLERIERKNNGINHEN
jgi:hypothetical protein